MGQKPASNTGDLKIKIFINTRLVLHKIQVNYLHKIQVSATQNTVNATFKKMLRSI